MHIKTGLIWGALLGLLAGLSVPQLLAAREAVESDAQSPMEFFRSDPNVDFPEPSPLLTNARGRDYQSINGKWDIIIDEAGIGWRVVTMGNYYRPGVRYPATGMRLKEHAFDERAQLVVPGDWNSQVAELDRYRGKILYHEQIDVDLEEDKNYFLHFGAANYTTVLFVNGKLVGRHRGGYTSFNFDITEFLVDGENTIVARVDAYLDDTTIPTMRTSDFWKYGGITRDVGLVTLPSTYISQYHLYLDDLESGEIRGWIQLAGNDIADRQIAVGIGAAGVALRLTSDGQGRAEFSVTPGQLELWSPRSPTLYDVSLTLDGNEITDRIGFRTVTTDGVNILLNGEPVRLRGISMHDESVLHPGPTNSVEDSRALLELVKELNANFVRLAHYPHSEHTVRLADEMGLMLWSEVPIVSMIDWDNPETLEVAKTQVSDNVTRDLNRAAIIMWSVSNESFPQTQARLDFLGELASTARKLDDSDRPVASALVGNPGEEFRDLGEILAREILQNPEVDADIKRRLMKMMEAAVGEGNPLPEKRGEASETGDEMTVVISDPLGEVVDIVGYNEYFGWYYSGHFAAALGIDEGVVRDAMLAIMPRIRFTNTFGKPMIISEFGAGAKHGLRSDDALIWSEEYQARVYRAQLKMLDKSPQVQGYSPWVLKDFRSHLRELNGIQETWNRKGLVSETGEKKLAFEVLADHYRKLEAESKKQ